MATQKKPAKKAKKKKISRATPSYRPIPSAYPAPQPEIVMTDSGSNNGVLTLLVIGLTAIIWLLWQGRHQQKVPAPDAAQAPDARIIASKPVARQPALSEGGAPPARVERAGEAREKGEPSLTLDRSLGKPLGFRCWRPEGGSAQLDVFGPRNKRVKTVKSEAGAAGWVTLDFDGKDEQGAALPVGLYFVRTSDKDEQQVMDVWVKG